MVVILIFLSLVGFLCLESFYSTSKNYKNIDSIVDKYEHLKANPLIETYLKFIPIYLEGGIDSDLKHNYSFSVFQMRKKEVEDVLTVLSMNIDHSTLKKDIATLAALAEQYPEVKETSYRVTVYNKMLNTQRNLEKLVQETFERY